MRNIVRENISLENTHTTIIQASFSSLRIGQHDHLALLLRRCEIAGPQCRGSNDNLPAGG